MGVTRSDGIRAIVLLKISLQGPAFLNLRHHAVRNFLQCLFRLPGARLKNVSGTSVNKSCQRGVGVPKRARKLLLSALFVMPFIFSSFWCRAIDVFRFSKTFSGICSGWSACVQRQVTRDVAAHSFRNWGSSNNKPWSFLDVVLHA